MVSTVALNLPLLVTSSYYVSIRFLFFRLRSGAQNLLTCHLRSLDFAKTLLPLQAASTQLLLQRCSKNRPSFRGLKRKHVQVLSECFTESNGKLEKECKNLAEKRNTAKPWKWIKKFPCLPLKASCLCTRFQAFHDKSLLLQNIILFGKKCLQQRCLVFQTSFQDLKILESKRSDRSEILHWNLRMRIRFGLFLSHVLLVQSSFGDLCVRIFCPDDVHFKGWSTITIHMVRKCISMRVSPDLQMSKIQGSSWQQSRHLPIVWIREH